MTTKARAVARACWIFVGLALGTPVACGGSHKSQPDALGDAGGAGGTAPPGGSDGGDLSDGASDTFDDADALGDAPFGDRAEVGATPDVAPDTLPQASPDAAPEARTDASVEATAEVGVDAPRDAAPEVSAGPSPDAPVDVPLPPANPSQWPTLGGDLLHSGFNTQELGKPPLSLAWTAVVSASAMGSVWPAVSNGRLVYVTSFNALQSNGRTARASALSPADGHAVWSFDAEVYESLENFGQPTIDGNHLYFTQCCGEPGTFMYALYATTGKLHWSQPYTSQHELSWAPVVAAGGVYFNGGAYGGFMGLKAANGAPLFNNTLFPQLDQWSPLFVGGELVAFVGGTLGAYDPTTGSPTWSVTVPWDFSYVAAAPSSDGKAVYFVSPPTLHAFKPHQDAALWSLTGDFSGMTAVANGTVYAISAGGLAAVDAKTGKQTWTFAADGALNHPPAVAGRWVYVSSDATVYAVDSSTHAKVWEASPGGFLSIADGHLYVARGDGKLAAYNFTP